MRAEAAAARPASRAQSLERCYERRKFATNTFSKLQRRNHEELLDYEVREAAAVYADGVRRIKEALAAALASKRLRCSLAQAAAEQRLAEIRCILDDDTPDAPRAAKRRAEDDGRCDPAADVTNGAAADVVLRASLPDADIRDDLRAIAQQLRARAELFVAHAPQAEACVVRTPGLPPALKCGGTCFQMGETVSVFSRATNHELLAYLDAIEDDEIRLRKLDDGRVLVVDLEQLRSERLLLHAAHDGREGKAGQDKGRD